MRRNPLHPSTIKDRTVLSETGCWIWTGMRHGTFGYGRIKLSGERPLAHRAAWLIFRGSIPDGLCVLHRCDVPACVNPDHLFLGTKADNNADKHAKGRDADNRGERNPAAKLSWEDVEQIRTLLKSHTQRAVALKFGVHPTTISLIHRERVWGAEAKKAQAA